MSQPALSSRMISNPYIRDEKRFGILDQCRASFAACRWSLHQVSTYRGSLAENLASYRAADIPAIGLWHRKIQDEGEELAVDLIAESGLPVSSVSWLGGFTGTEGMSHDESLEQSKAAIEFAGRVGARSVVVVGGARGRHIMSHARRCVRSALVELGDAAADAGVTVLLQADSRPLCRPWSFFDKWEDALELVAGCDHPRVKLAVDLHRLLPENAPQRRLDEIVPFLGQVQIPCAESTPFVIGYGLRTSAAPSTVSLRGGLASLATGLAMGPSDRVLALRLAGFTGYVEIEAWSEHVWQTPCESWLAPFAQRWNVLPTRAN